MLGHRQKLEVAEPHVFHIGHQPLRQFAVTQKFTFRATLPGPQVNLIDRHRAVLPVAVHAALQPRLILPLVAGRVRYDGRRLGTLLEVLTVRIGLDVHGPGIAVTYFVLVQCARPEIRNKELPHA